MYTTAVAEAILKNKSLVSNMGSAEKFCLRWNDFESNISKAFSEIRDDKDFFDVTLACEGEQIEAHKVVLSACSPFFQTILKRNRHEHPLLYLKGVKYIDLMAVLNFMYHGEVNVAQEDLNSFLAIAEDLKVKGLTQNTTEEVTKQQNTLKPRPRDLPGERPTKSSYQSGTTDEDNEVECVPVKTEPSSFVQEHDHIQVEDVVHKNQVAERNLDNSMYEEHYADYGNYEEGAEAGFNEDLMTTNSADGNKAYLTFCERTLPHLENVSQHDLKCRLCDKTGYHKMQMMKHVETNHLKTNDPSYGYFCDICSQFCLSYNILMKHKRVSHRK